MQNLNDPKEPKERSTIGRTTTQHWYWMPAVGFVLGALSTVLLVLINGLNEKQYEVAASADTVMALQLKAATAHLWFEEAITGNSLVDIGNVWSDFDHSVLLAEALLNGGEVDHGIMLAPLDDEVLRSDVETLIPLLMRLKNTARERFRQAKNAGIGTDSDAQFNVLFKEIMERTKHLEGRLAERAAAHRAGSKRLFWGVLLAWALMITVVIRLIWNREQRRKSAEEALRDAHDQLEQRVRERTAELTTSNEILEREITERKQAEGALRASEDKCRMLVERLPQEIYLKDRNSVYVYCNDHYAGRFHVSREHITGKTDYDLYPEELAQRYFDEDRRILESGTSVERDERHGNNAHEVVIHKFKMPVKDEKGDVSGILGICWDVTERLRLEAIAEAMNTTQNIGYIFSGVSHEIGNPVNSIKTTLSVLREKVEIFPREKIREYTDHLLSETARMEYLLLTLKNFNMFETPDLRKVPLRLFIDDFLSLAAVDLDKKGIRVESSLEPEADSVYADPRALQQVMLNIISNAADALEGREGPGIKIKASKAGDFTQLTVSDNGCGISEEKQRDLFKPFRTTKATGTGLGLILVRKMLSGMNGSIRITSRKDTGTRVEIFLPRGKT
jgi:PAS domain S-box-containing protein